MTSVRSNSWQAILADLRQRIVDGRWVPGQLIPGEVELAEQFGCSRTTVNRALRELAATGVIDRKRKAGTTVTRHRAQRVSAEIPIIKMQIEARRKRYEFSLLQRTHIKPPASIQKRLKLTENAKALHVRTLHMASGKPFIYEDRWVNTRTVPAILKANLDVISVNEWLVSQVPLSKGELFLSARSATKVVAKILQVQIASPVLEVDRQTWLDGRSVTCAKLFHEPGHQIRLEI